MYTQYIRSAVFSLADCVSRLQMTSGLLTYQQSCDLCNTPAYNQAHWQGSTSTIQVMQWHMQLLTFNMLAMQVHLAGFSSLHKEDGVRTSMSASEGVL